MQSFLSTFQKYIKPEDYIVLAVSGWVDSMVLFDMILRQHPRSQIIVVHFDHSLRWVESDMDRDLVANICNRENIKFEVQKMNIGSMAKTENMNLESIARRERYSFLEQVREKYNASYILTAHHAVDQTETIIGNMIKWAKVRGLSGILELSGYILRPLLQVSKLDILWYAENHRVEHREDITNQDTSYDRNRIRHNIIPVLESLNPSIHNTMSELGLYMQDLGTFLTWQVENWLKVSEIESGKPDSFLIASFMSLSPFLQSEIVSYLYAHAQWGSTQWLSRGLIDELIRFVSDPGSYGKKEIKKLSLERRRERIILL